MAVAAEFNNQTCSGAPEVNAAGGDAPSLTGVPTITPCANGGEDGDAYAKTTGTWTGSATDPFGSEDFPLNGPLTIIPTYIEATSGTWIGNGVASGKAKLKLGGGVQVSGVVYAVTERVDATHVIGRGFWKAKIAPGSGDSLWANFELQVDQSTSTIAVDFGIPPVPNFNNLPFSAEYNGQIC